MMKSSFYALFIALCTFFTFGCEEDVELFTNKQAQTAIYGILNIKDTIQYVKVYKTFVEKDGDISSFLSNPQKFYYDTSEIEVFLLRWHQGSLLQKVRLKHGIIDTLGAPADNQFYYTKELLDGNSEYEIQVKIKDSGKIVSSKIKPYGTRGYAYSFYNESRAIGIQNYFLTSKMEYLDGEDMEDLMYSNYGNHYNRLLYYEIKDGDTCLKHFEWDEVPKEYIIPLDCLNGQLYTYELRYIAANIGHEPHIKRIAAGLDQLIPIESPELKEYRRNTSISRSEFNYVDYLDNVQNGYGFVASRYMWCFYAMKLRDVTLDSLAHGRYTKYLNFADSQGNFHFN